jgi:transcriptional regulatory protein GAL4
MAGGRRVRSSASERAYLQCQKRKTRCVSNGSTDAICSYCAKMSKECVFETPPTRTPLTRRNLDAAEARCKELELRLRQLQPATKTKLPTSSGQKRDAAVAFRKEDSSVISSHSASAVRRHVESPAELGFEWQEVSSLGNSQSPFEEKKIQDGMVSLAASGYSSKLG